MKIDEGYIRGFFDADGFVYIGDHLHKVDYHGKTNRTYRYRRTIMMVAFTNTNVPLLEGIKSFLESKGYHPKLRNVTPRTKPRSGQILGTKPMYNLELTNVQEMVRFGKEIGSNHPDKAPKFADIETAIRNRPGRYRYRGKASLLESQANMQNYSKIMI